MLVSLFKLPVVQNDEMIICIYVAVEICMRRNGSSLSLSVELQVWRWTERTAYRFFPSPFTAGGHAS